MTTTLPIPQINLLTCDRANSVNRRTTATGTRTFAHNAFGYRAPTDNDAPGAGFNGEYLEPHGTYLLGSGYRAYRPTLGRFDAPDSYSPFMGGGLNSYTYCRGEPVNRRDPSGHSDQNGFSFALFGLGALAMLYGSKGRSANRYLTFAAGAGAVVSGIAGLASGSNQGKQTAFTIAGAVLLVAGLGGAAFSRRRAAAAKRVGGGESGGISPTPIPSRASVSSAAPHAPVPPPLPTTVAASNMANGGAPQDLLASILNGGGGLRRTNNMGALAARDAYRLPMPDLDHLLPAERFKLAQSRAQNLTPGQLLGGQQTLIQNSRNIRTQ